MPAALPPGEARRRHLERQRRWKQNNREHIRAYKRRVYAKDRKRILARQKELETPAKKARRAESYKRWLNRPGNRERVRAISTRWVKNNKARNRQLYTESYYRLHDRKKAASRKKWIAIRSDPVRHAAHKEMFRPIARRIRARRWKTDPAFRIMCGLRTRLVRLIKNCGGEKCDSGIKLVGCSGEELRLHLERQWLPRMSWTNYGFNGWHIDHIKPISSFNLLEPDEQRTCFHFSNLQPLWAADNLRKSNRLDWQAAA